MKKSKGGSSTGEGRGVGREGEEGIKKGDSKEERGKVD